MNILIDCARCSHADWSSRLFIDVLILYLDCVGTWCPPYLNSLPEEGSRMIGARSGEAAREAFAQDIAR
jgi:hypothetical protein